MQKDLAHRIEAGCVVVTPNRRLAAHVTREYDDRQLRSGRLAWPAADILPFSTFVERAYEDALYSEGAGQLPIPLTPIQEQVIWENLIRDSSVGGTLLAVPDTAALAREAWQLSHAWQLMPQLGRFPLSEDGKAFREWARRYEAATRRERHTDLARLPDLLAPLLGQAGIRKPKSLVCYGFDRVTPQQASFLESLAAAGCDVVSAGPETHIGKVQRAACADSADEIGRAAAWSRARLEAGSKRIGIVVPALTRNRSVIKRVFSAVMEPDYALPGVEQRVFPFNLSLGEPLSSYPLVNAALLLLDLAGKEMDFERASQLIRSPFLAGADVELTRRAELDAALRKTSEPVITLDRLAALVAREDKAVCPVLRERLTALAEFRKRRLFGAQAPSAMAKAISEALALVGFPGARGLDSSEYQTLKKWHDMVAGFATLDRVVPRTGYRDALSRLRKMCRDTLFQPETPEVPIQILGMLEAAGTEFEHLWVMGLSDDAWPPGPRPNPFLPIELQRAAGLPQASAAESLELARRHTREWLSCADDVVLSYPRREDDRELKPSPLIAAVPELPLSVPDYPRYRDVVHRSRDIESAPDAQAPPLDGAAVAGGTAVIRDHAACPFRAFAQHRLAARSLETPHTGLDPMERGTLVHRVLAQVWRQVKTRSALDAIGEASLAGLLEQAADEAVARVRRERPTVLSGRFAGIERRRLARLAREWLQLEKGRGAFTVLATEDQRSIEIGGLRVNARLDRIDVTDDGRRIVIDYKTGKASPSAILGGRPDEPQLPLYLVGAEPDAVALAFAEVKAGGMQFTGLARDADVLPGARTLPDGKLKQAAASWGQQVEAWRADLPRIAAGFAAGEAAVDPKQYPNTCRTCDVTPFCRIYERLEKTLDENLE